MTQPVPDYIEAKNLADYQQREEVVLLDVRDQRSFQQRHLPDAVWMLPNVLGLKLTPWITKNTILSSVIMA